MLSISGELVKNFSTITDQLKTLQNDNDFYQFIKLSDKIINEYVNFSTGRLEKIIMKNKRLAESESSKHNDKQIREEYIKIKSESSNKEFI
ncbi:uncharacterized protein METZ01_LOCUS270615, partial [marine metagenome]